MNHQFACVLASLLLGACATGTPGGSPATASGAAASTAGEGDGSKIRCVYTAGTRSRLQTRDCRTEAEWERIQKASEAKREREDVERGSGS